MVVLIITDESMLMQICTKILVIYIVLSLTFDKFIYKPKNKYINIIYTRFSLRFFALFGLMGKIIVVCLLAFEKGSHYVVLAVLGLTKHTRVILNSQESTYL